MSSAPFVNTKPEAIQMDESFNLDVRSDTVIMTYPDDKEIIFNILIADALKYNKTGGKAEIAIDSSNNDAILIFTDTGIGIAQNDMETFFSSLLG